MPILALKPVTGQEVREKPERRSLSDRFKQLHVNAGYVTVKSSVNNEIRFVGNSRLPGKFAGDKTAEKNLERQAKSIDYILTQLADKLNNNKYQQSKLRKEFETTGNKDLLQEIATIDLENRGIDAILTGKDFQVFGGSVKDNLGITDELRELIKTGFLDKVKSDRIKEKKDYSEGNRPIKFGKNARHSCLEAGQVMQMLYGNNVVFSTFTIPGRTEEAKKAVADFSSVGMDRILGVLRDYAKYHGVDIDYIYVWEYHQDNTLHLHLAWGCNSLDIHMDRICQLLDDCWFRFLDDLGTTDPAPIRSKKGNFPGIDVYERLPEGIERGKKPEFKSIKSWKNHRSVLDRMRKTVKHEKCEKSPAGYMAKYVSKGVNQPNKDSSIYYPSTMWGQSKRLNDIAKEYEIRQDFPKADNDYLEVIDYYGEFIDYAIKNDWIASWNYSQWDIYSQVDPNTGKSIRTNRKGYEPRPINSNRVSNGSQVCMYIKPEYFIEAREYLTAVTGIPKALKSAPPKDFNKFHANRYYADIQEKIDDNDIKKITAKRYARSRNYWERIAAGENYQDIELLK